jgi:hypothetical protein
MFGRIGSGGNKGNDKNSKGGDKGNSNNNDKGNRGVEGSNSTHEVCYKGSMWSDKGRSDGIYDYTGKSCSTSSYHSNTTSKGGEGSISGGGGVGSQFGSFDHRLHQLHPRDAETFIERIKASESEIQKYCKY